MELLRLDEAFTVAPVPRRSSKPGTGNDGCSATTSGVDAIALVGRVGGEVAEPLTRALDRLHAFAATGRIDRSGLRALRDDIDRARRIGLRAQRIGQVGATPASAPAQRRGLPQALRDALAQRVRDTGPGGVEVRQDLQPVEVAVDGALLHELLQALLDWCFDHARSAIDLRVDCKPWPPQPRLRARFVHMPPDQSPASDAGSAALDCVAWRLLEQTARVAGLTLRRDDTAVTTCVQIEFPHTADASAIVLDGVTTTATSTRRPAATLAGRHLLVVAARRETRNAIREALRPTAAVIDYVASVDAADDFCRHGMPQAIVYEAALAGEAFRRMRGAWSGASPALVYVEVAESGRAVEVLERDGERTTRIGRDVIATALTDALLFEWAQPA